MLWLVEWVREVLPARFCNGHLHELHAVTFGQGRPPIEGLAYQPRSCGQPIEIHVIAVFRIVNTVCEMSASGLYQKQGVVRRYRS